jgi:hypothetical protein
MPIQQDIHVYIQFIQWNIHDLSNTLSKHIQMVIQAYPTEYPNISRGISHLSDWISNWISDLNCGPGNRAGSCISIPICILAPGPASSAASGGQPPCSERKRGVCNACSYPTARPPALRQRQVRQACVCDIADPSIAVHARMDIMISMISGQR